MKTKEEILKEFDEIVFGDCFAGGIFVNDEEQVMYTSGFKEGFNKAKNMSKQFLIKALDQTREETIREVEGQLPKYVSGANLNIEKILNRLKK